MSAPRINFIDNREESVKRCEAIGDLKLKDIGVLYHMFCYSGVDDEYLDHHIQTVEKAICSLAYGADSEQPFFGPVMDRLAEYLKLLKDAESEILDVLKEGGDQWAR